MATQKVKNDTVVAGVAFGAGLLALLLWPNRQNADQDLVFIVRLATLTVVGASVDWLAFQWRPTFDLVAFLTMTGRRGRLARAGTRSLLFSACWPL